MLSLGTEPEEVVQALGAFYSPTPAQFFQYQVSSCATLDLGEIPTTHSSKIL